MNKYNRYFEFKTGALLNALVDATRQNDASLAEIKIIQQEIGAKSQYVARSQAFAAFLFDTPPEPKLFRKLHGGFYPKKGTPLHARVSALTFVDTSTCLEAVGLPNAPTLFGDSKVYFPQCILLPWEAPVAYLCVPWYDEDPSVLEEYKADRSDGKRYSSNYDSLLWTPPEEGVEIKSWQFEKAIDEWNQHVRGSNKAA